jgi:hypothetical protein
MSLSSTKLVMSNAWMESRLGLKGQQESENRDRAHMPQQKVTEPQKVERYLDVLLRVPCADMVWRVVVLGADGEDGKEYGEPGCRDRPCRLGRGSSVLCPVLEVDHEP